jgi:hypothetical protein
VPYPCMSGTMLGRSSSHGTCFIDTERLRPGSKSDGSVVAVVIAIPIAVPVPITLSVPVSIALSVSVSIPIPISFVAAVSLLAFISHWVTLEIVGIGMDRADIVLIKEAANKLKTLNG